VQVLFVFAVFQSVQGGCDGCERSLAGEVGDGEDGGEHDA